MEERKDELALNIIYPALSLTFSLRDSNRKKSSGTGGRRDVQGITRFEQSKDPMAPGQGIFIRGKTKQKTLFPWKKLEIEAREHRGIATVLKSRDYCVHLPSATC